MTTSASTPRTVAVLGYHKIGDPPPPPDGWESWFYVSEDIFARQLEFLDTHGWRVIGMSDFLHGLDDPLTLPERAALVTFDDGYRSLLDAGARQLARFGYPGVVFVPTAYIGGHNTFDADDEPPEQICSWDDLRELDRRGISVQSHSVTHTTLSQLTPDQQERELIESKRILEDGLGKTVDAFAYPYGDSGLGRDWRAKRKALTLALDRAGYRVAYLYGGGRQSLPPRDQFRIARIAMGPDTDLSAELGDR